jgi:hypothetical protein
MAREDTSGPAADTGTAVHAAAAHYHTQKKGADAAVKAMRAGLNEYPFADLDTAEAHFRAYAGDPRNVSANVILCEAKVRLVPPRGQRRSYAGRNRHRGDARSSPRSLRKADGRGYQNRESPEGADMLDSHCLQLCAYQLAASAHLGKPVTGAAILRTRDYLKTDRSRKVSANPARSSGKRPGPTATRRLCWPASPASWPLSAAAVSGRSRATPAGSASGVSSCCRTLQTLGLRRDMRADGVVRRRGKVAAGGCSTAITRYTVARHGHHQGYCLGTGVTLRDGTDYQRRDESNHLTRRRAHTAVHTAGNRTKSHSGCSLREIPVPRKRAYLSHSSPQILNGLA